jgi:hypothetical protein
MRKAAFVAALPGYDEFRFLSATRSGCRCCPIFTPQGVAAFV